MKATIKLSNGAEYSPRANGKHFLVMNPGSDKEELVRASYKKLKELSNTKLDKLLKEQYPEHKEKYDVEKVEEEMMRLIREQAVDNLVNKSFDTEKE